MSRAGARLEVERLEERRILLLRLAAPKANILDRPMLDAIGGALEGLELDSALRAILFEGAGPNFSFGASVEEHRPERVAEMLARFHGLFRRLIDLGVPTVAIVRGQCLGGGLELASFASWIFAAPSAVFGQPEIKLGVFPPLASLLLPWRLGGGAALDLCVSGRSIGAAEAQRRGLVHAVAEDPASAALDFVREHLLPLSATSLRFAERAARSDLLSRLERALPALERLYLDELMATPDAVEGIQAFLDKRPPRFGGSRSGGSSGSAP
jgi:cyclohexa-1,5-dienecarbonyl-CoA hydratase